MRYYHYKNYTPLRSPDVFIDRSSIFGLEIEYPTLGKKLLYVNDGVPHVYDITEDAVVGILEMQEFTENYKTTLNIATKTTKSGKRTYIYKVVLESDNEIIIRNPRWDRILLSPSMNGLLWNHKVSKKIAKEIDYVWCNDFGILFHIEPIDCDHAALMFYYEPRDPMNLKMKYVTVIKYRGIKYGNGKPMDVYFRAIHGDEEINDIIPQYIATVVKYGEQKHVWRVYETYGYKLIEGSEEEVVKNIKEYTKVSSC